MRAHLDNPVIVFAIALVAQGILPLVVSISFFLIADLDSPRGGAFRVHPQNLLAASQSMKAP